MRDIINRLNFDQFVFMSNIRTDSEFDSELTIFTNFSYDRYKLQMIGRFMLLWVYPRGWKYYFLFQELSYTVLRT